MNKLHHLIMSLAVGAFLAAKITIDRSGIARTRTQPIVTQATAKLQVKSLHQYSLGLDNAIASLLWVRLLQDAQHIKMTQGEVSWEYVQIASILELDPSFLSVYNFGASFLSIFRQDKLGAKKVLEAWTQRQPNYWRAHYTLGYHLFAEMGDFEGASKSLFKAASLENAPSWLGSLGVRLLGKAGMMLSALDMSINLYSSARDVEGAYRIGRRIRALRYQLELNRWNNALERFRADKHREPRDLSDLRAYYKQSDRSLASLERSIEIPEPLEPIFNERFDFYYSSTSKSISAHLSNDDRYLEQIGPYGLGKEGE